MSDDTNSGPSIDLLMELRPLSIDHSSSEFEEQQTALIEAIMAKGGQVHRTIDRFDGHKIHSVKIPELSVDELKSAFPDLHVEPDTPIQLF